MWLGCSGSLIPNLLAPDNAGVDAAYGTVAHEVTETWLKSRERPDHLVGETRRVVAGGTPYLIEIDEEMVEYAHDCVRWVSHLPKPWRIETKVDFSDLTPLPRQRGTADFIAFGDGTLYIRDWKFGRGVKVFAKGNTQLRLYAYGAWMAHRPRRDVKRVNMGIGQPRLEHFETDEISVEDLRDFAAYVAKRAAAAWRVDAPRSPSPKACQWCKVRATCSALAAQTNALVDASFDDLTDAPDLSQPRDPKTISTERLAEILRWRKTIENWLSDAYDELARRAAFEDVPGWKLVQGHGRRAWKNPVVTERVLRRLGIAEDDILTRDLLTPNKAEHVLKAHGIGGKSQRALLAVLVSRPPGPVTLVEDHDTRPALSPPGDVFENHGEQE